jgi:predicted metal-dependent phosphoesterase TrpH
MKCDLHVHSVHSGACTTPVFRRFCRESYSDPEELYSRLKRLGMGLVTLTDHDSIDGLEALRGHSDFFISEEVTCRMPSGTEAHIGVYDISEAQHVEIQRRRNDLISLLTYLTEKRIFYVLNHAFSDLTGRRDPDDFVWFEAYFQAMETRNSLLPPIANRCAQSFAKASQKIAIGGSDAHTVVSAGTAFTEVADARTKEEFFAGLREGHGTLGGALGTAGGRWLKLTRDVLLVAGGMMRERPATAALAPAAFLLPVVMLGQTLHATAFAWLWEKRARRMRGEPAFRMPWEAGVSVETLSWP